MAVIVGRMDRIDNKARRLATEQQLRKALIGVLTALPYILGWTTRKLVMAIWVVAAWLVAAVAVGWQSAGPRQPD